MIPYKGNTVYNESEVTPQWVRDEIEKKGKGVFICEVGVTTFEAAKEEYNKGKVLFAKSAGMSVTIIIPLTRFNNSQFDFYGKTEDFRYFKAILDSNGWTSNFIEYDNELNYASNNAVKNSTLYSVIGDVETLLASL